MSFDACLQPNFRRRRYETFWLNFMAEELALCPGTLVVAHGTAADAVLRFVENREVGASIAALHLPFQFVDGKRNDSLPEVVLPVCSHQVMWFKQDVSAALA